MPNAAWTTNRTCIKYCLQRTIAMDFSIKNINVAFLQFNLDMIQCFLPKCTYVYL